MEFEDASLAYGGLIGYCNSVAPDEALDGHTDDGIRSPGALLLENVLPILLKNESLG